MDKEPDFEMVIQRHLTRAHKLRAIQQMIAEDPGIVPELLTILSDPTNTEPATQSAPDVRRRVDAKTQAQKVVDYFMDNDNDLASIRDIAEGTGLTRNTVNALLRNSAQKDQFVCVKVGPKKTLWRVKEDEGDEGGEVDPEELGLSESDFEENDSDESEA